MLKFRTCSNFITSLKSTFFWITCYKQMLKTLRNKSLNVILKIKFCRTYTKTNKCHFIMSNNTTFKISLNPMLRYCSSIHNFNNQQMSPDWFKNSKQISFCPRSFEIIFLLPMQCMWGKTIVIRVGEGKL